MTHVDNPEITAVEWCFGAGGNHLGLRRVIPGLRLVALSEIEAYAAVNVATKMEARAVGQADKQAFLLEPAPNWTDCRTFPCELLRDRVALFIASYPCQGESHAGKRLGAKDPRWLWPAVRRGVEEMRPIRCFFENVEGHISKGLRTVCRDLEALGYRVACGIFSAEECGAHHRRKRIFILGELDDAAMPRCDHEGQWTETMLSSWQRLFGAGCGKLADASAELWHESGRRNGSCRSYPSQLGNALEELADTERCGLGEGELFQARQSYSAEREQELADSANGGRGVRGQSSGRYRQLDWYDEELADAQYSGSQRLRREHRLSGSFWQEEVDRPSDDLADTILGSLPAFPPGPTDLAAWRQVLEIDPSLEPALCRMVDGLANRVDRLRLTGNGVVPDTAALAYLTLDRELSL